MPREEKITFIETVTAAILIAVAFILRFLVKIDVLPYEISLIRTGIYMFLFMMWGISVKRRVLNENVRHYLISVAFLMLFWFAVRSMKYHFFANMNVQRYLWYAYYVPMIFIPLFSFFISLMLGKSEYYTLPKWTKIFYLPAAVLLLLVLTNDIHQLVFVFPQDAEIFTSADYSYDVGYYIVLLWEAGISFLSFGVMAYKCRVPHKRRIRLMPLIPIILIFIYGILYGNDIIMLFFGDMTAVFCVLIACTFEANIRCRLIQSNMGYQTIFSSCSLPVEITDSDFNVEYTSGEKMRTFDFEKCCREGSVAIDRNTVVKQKNIYNGYVFWQKDVEKLADIMELLKANKEKLSHKNEIERQNYAAEKRLNSLREKNRLYDTLKDSSQKQYYLLLKLLEEYTATENFDLQKNLLAKAAIIGAYIKRSGNLLFIGRQNGVISAMELKFAFEESLSNIRLLRTECAFFMRTDASFKTEQALQIYSFFETAIETAMDDLKALLINIRESDGRLIFNISAESNKDLGGLMPLADSYEFSVGCSSFTLRFDKEGEV